MSRDTQSLFDGISRRDVLNGGIASTAALTLGTATVTGAREIRGGNLLVVGKPPLGTPFTLGPGPFDEFFIPASRQASESELENYDTFSVVYRDGSDPQLAAINRGETDFDSTGETAYVFTSVQGCREPDVPDVRRAPFRPF
jgi:hypothetical protein